MLGRVKRKSRAYREAPTPPELLAIDDGEQMIEWRKFMMRKGPTGFEQRYPTGLA